MSLRPKIVLILCAVVGTFTIFDFLIQRIAPSLPPTVTPFFGLWSDLGVDLSADDLDAARREQWNGFPREDLP